MSFTRGFDAFLAVLLLIVGIMELMAEGFPSGGMAIGGATAFARLAAHRGNYA